MKKLSKYLSILIVPLFFMITNVYAEVDYNDTTCSNASQVYLNKVAYNVTAAYELVTDENGGQSFDISIYNIIDDISIKLENTNVEKSGLSFILPSQTVNGTYKFNVPDIDTIITYRITVMTTKFGCNKSLRTFELVKPMKNKFHDEDICKYASVQDYYYCQEWLTEEMGMSDFSVRQKIQEKIKDESAKTTTAFSLEEETKVTGVTEAGKKALMKRTVILVIIAAILITIVIIVTTLIKIRRARL